jgi:hypothetical protein
VTAVRITLTVEVVERDGQVVFSATDTEIRPPAIAGETRDVHRTLARGGVALTNRLSQVLIARFGTTP